MHRRIKPTAQGHGISRATRPPSHLTEARMHRPRAHRQHRHPRLPQFQAQPFAERRQASLGSSVKCKIRYRQIRRERRQVDDPAPLLRQTRQKPVRQPQRRLHIHLHHATVTLPSTAGVVPVIPEPGIVNQQSRPRRQRLPGSQQPLRIRLLRQITDMHRHLGPRAITADALRQLLHGLLPPRRQVQTGTLRRQCLRKSGTQTRGSPRDEHVTILHAAHDSTKTPPARAFFASVRYLPSARACGRLGT